MSLQGLLPRAAIDVAGAVLLSSRSWTTSGCGVRTRSSRPPTGSTVLPPVKSGSRRPSWPARWPRSTREVRAALEVAIERVRMVHAAQRRDDVTTQVVPGGTVTERWVPVRRVGLYVPGGLAMYPSSVVMNVVPAQIAGVDAIAVASPPQQETGRPDAAGARRLRAARRRRGLRGRRRPGDRHVRLRRRASCEPVDLITGPGNIYVTAAKRLLRGLVGIDAEAGPDRDRDPRRRHRRPGARRRRPDQPGRARPVGGERAGHRLGGAGRRGRRRAGPAGAADQARRADHDRADRAAVRHACSSTTSRPGCGGRRLRGRAPGDPDPGRRRLGGAGPQRRRDLRRRLLAGLARRLLRRLQPRAAHRRLRPAQRRPVGAVVPAGHPRDRVRRGGAARASRRTS